MEPHTSSLGKYIMLIGAAIVLVGLIYYFGKGKQVFGWIGNLPGDIRVERENMRFYFPITTMILVSVLFNLVMRLFR